MPKYNLTAKNDIDEFINYIESTDTVIDDSLKIKLEELKNTL